MHPEDEFRRWMDNPGSTMKFTGASCQTVLLPECAPGTTFTYNGVTYECVHEVHPDYTRVFWEARPA